MTTGLFSKMSKPKAIRRVTRSSNLLRTPKENVWKFLPRYLVANSMSMKHNSKYSLHWFQAKFDFTKFSSRFLSFVFIRARLEISASAIERGGPRQPKQKCKQNKTNSRFLRLSSNFVKYFTFFSYFFRLWCYAKFSRRARLHRS